MSKKDSDTNPDTDYQKQFELAKDFWRNWANISKDQKEIADNYKDIFFGLGSYRQCTQLAPPMLKQTIDPWDFSLIRVTNQSKGDPVLESKILKQAGGYGSQLGTIIDFLQLLAKEYQLEEKLTDSQDKDKVRKIKELAEKIEKIKQQ
jgi:hypothetical protein